MNGACLKKSLVFYATLSCSDKNYKPKLYKGSYEISFEKRYSSHKRSFNVPLFCTKLSTEYWNFKVGLSPSKNICVICLIESPLKMMKNAFYFILKALFVLKIFKFLPRLLGHVGKTA